MTFKPAIPTANTQLVIGGYDSLRPVIVHPTKHCLVESVRFVELS
jgi:hypothetical protein